MRPLLGMTGQRQERMVHGTLTAVPDRWLEPHELLRLVERDVTVQGIESPREVIMREPSMLIPVRPPSVPALDLDTYRARLARWDAGEGPELIGMHDFMQALAEQVAPACAVTAQGHSTNYVFLLNADLTGVVAAVAINAPSA